MNNKWWDVPAVTLLMLVLAIISTYPLVLHFDTAIPFGAYEGGKVWNRTGDQMQLLYWFWLVKENITGAVPFDTNPFEFNMATDFMTTGLVTFPISLLYVLFSPLGKITAFNCSIVTTYLFSGVFMYLLVRNYCGSRAGGVLAAIIFTFAPSRINGLTGGNLYSHLFFCYPWIVFFMEKGIQTTKIRYGVLSGIGLILLSMLEAHLLYYICLFLVAYIPIRCIAILPAHPVPVSTAKEEYKGIYGLSVPRSLLLSWGAGVIAVLYSQALYACRDNNPFFSQYFWWIIGSYPIIFVLTTLGLSLLYQHLLHSSFQKRFAMASSTLLPLYSLILLAILAWVSRALDTRVVVGTMIVLVVTAGVFLLRKDLLIMLRQLLKGFVENRDRMWPVLPVILAIGYVVVWIPIVKANKFESTIAASGRTLNDVRLYSAHFEDIFLSSSNVYIGILPWLLMGIFFLVILWQLCIQRRFRLSVAKSELLTIFYLLVAFSSYILALGLSFGKSSLFLLLYHFLPYFNYPRVSDRIVVLALFAIAVVAGFAVQNIQARCNKFWLPIVTMAILAASVLQLKDYNINKPTGLNILDRGQSIYTHVAENIGDGLLLELPLWPGDSHQSSLYQHYAMIDRVPRVNGYSPLVRNDYVETVFKPLATLNRGRLDPQQYKRLQELGVKFITVHNNGDVFPKKVSPFGPVTTVRRLQNSPYLEYIDIDNFMYFKKKSTEKDNLHLFRLKDGVMPAEAADSPYWYEMPYVYNAHYRLRRSIGKIIRDESIGRDVFQASADRDKPGYIAHGPYNYFAPGNYRCYFSIKTSLHKGNKEKKEKTSARDGVNMARIEVVMISKEGKQTILAQSEIPDDTTVSGYQMAFLDFTLPEFARLGGRVFYHGKGEVRVEKIAVYKPDQHLPLYSLEAEKMVGQIGRMVSVEKASSGRVVEAVVGKRKKKLEMVYGPSRIYPKGEYRVSYFVRKLQTEKAQNSDIAAELFVTDSLGSVVFSRRKVKNAELGIDKFKEFVLEFTIDREEDLSFHAKTGGTTNLQLDRIEVVKM